MAKLYGGHQTKTTCPGGLFNPGASTTNHLTDTEFHRAVRESANRILFPQLTSRSVVVESKAPPVTTTSNPSSNQ